MGFIIIESPCEGTIKDYFHLTCDQVRGLTRGRHIDYRTRPLPTLFPWAELVRRGRGRGEGCSFSVALGPPETIRTVRDGEPRTSSTLL